MANLRLTLKQYLLMVLSYLAFCLPAVAAGEEEGFHPLFDGKSLLGWTLMHGQGPGYVAEDGLLFCPAEGGGNLYTKEQFGDFIFRFEFKLEPGGNNGVGIRTPLEGNPAYQGMEIQILDDYADKYANLRPAQYHGSIYDVFPAKRGVLKKAGEWNEEEIFCKGSKVRITLNGKVIVDADLDTVKDPGVLKAHPGLRRASGHIGFLGHGSNVWFRNIRIKDLGLNVPPEGFSALFNGKDLTGWKGLVKDPPSRAKMSSKELAAAQAKADKRMRDHWRVEDGVLVFDGKGDSLCSAKDYADFELFVDWKILPRGDSGIYLRGSPQVQIWENDVGSGGLYNNKKNPSKPLVKADNLIGEWNRFRIIMIGEKVTIYLNGQKAVDDVTMENYWERDKPIYPAGAIELQNHGNTLYFRNVFVREIKGEQEKKEKSEIKGEPKKEGVLKKKKVLKGRGPKPVKVGIIDVEDHWLEAKGLAIYLEGAGVAYRDLTDQARSAKTPSAMARSAELDLANLDALLIGSFATADPAIHEGLDRNKDAIRTFILEGGVVAEFTQADQEQDWVDWLPPPLKARRCDLDHTRPCLPDPEHSLLSGIGSADLLHCAFPGKTPFWETFSEHQGFAVLGAADLEGDAAFLLEGTAGKGRVLLFSMTPDKAMAMEDSVKKNAPLNCWIT